ncbi:MAG: hypothetical protein UW60_C0003G0033 [Candidatus Woesebacteria bacterium GW2011_GWA2_44_33]|uniref:Uncharacterized protein n=1 Tax=Candidatus Woesebacteria bacterium GW2011_GWA2_44_33 TaxID=1618564 RepID=A0A0G1J8Q3_9BACT|nr:MAG: hypothetical protein UW60_C0003G0033 [Candidatus Woesebacteria bacterium GW2011_GWA2_44_33]
MKIIYKLLAIYTLIVIVFLAFFALQTTEFSKVSYFWGSYQYIVGKFTLIPVIIFAGWSIIKKESKKV